MISGTFSPRGIALIALGGLGAIAGGTILANARPGMLAPSHAPPPLTAEAESPASRAVLVQIFRGDTLAARPEISITTIFPERTFSVLADAADGDVQVGSEEELIAQVRDLFSLKSVVSLGSSLVTLPGGAAMVNDDGREIRVTLQAWPVSERAVRLVISAARGTEETVATSVVVRLGKTIVLAGPAEGAGGSKDRVLFLCLTPLPARAELARAAVPRGR